MAIQLQTYGEQLADVQQAIRAVLTSQRYEINGRMVQRADLEWLQKREIYLTEQYQRFGDTKISKSTNTGAMRVNFT